MSRLLRILSSRTDLRTGKSVSASGSLPLTIAGTFGGFALQNYGVFGAVRSFNNTTAINPLPPVFVGETLLPGGGKGLSLVFTTEGSAGGGDSVTATFPSTEPLRAVGSTRDELDFSSGKVIRRVGVCRNPTVLPGVESTYGRPYPSVTLEIRDTTAPPSLSTLLSTHWATLRRSDFNAGTAPGMLVYKDVFSVNLPRATYRKYVTGCVGRTEESDGRLEEKVPAGEYRCDFYDGSSRVFTLPVGLDGIEDGYADVLAVSRGSATLIKNVNRRTVTSTDNFTALSDYEDTGETVFRVAKAAWGGKEYEDEDDDEYAVPAFSSHFLFDWMSPDELIDEYDEDPAFCGDGEYWYFHVPGVSDLTEFGSFLSEEAQAGTPVTVVYPADEPTVSVLASYSASSETVGTVARLADVAGGISDNYVFDLSAEYTLIPAFREFLAAESAAGRVAEIYYVLPTPDVTESEIDLPVLTACEGSTTFSVRAADGTGLDPAEGSFTAFSEE